LLPRATRNVDDALVDATAVLSTAYPHRDVERTDLSTVSRQRRVVVAGYGATKIAVDSSVQRAPVVVAPTSFSGVCEQRLPRKSKTQMLENFLVREIRSCTSVHSSYPQHPSGAYACVRAQLARYRQFSTSRIHSNDNDLWKTLLLRFVSGFSRLPSRSHRGRVLPCAARVFRIVRSMHLVSCTTPPGSLEAAPRTALLADPSVSESDQWDGFWSPQTDGYYARCTHRDGEVEWFAVADEEAVSGSASVDADQVSASTDACDNPRHDATRQSARVAVIVARSPDGRRMLVGSARRAGGRRA
jgi:hypothetical protein